MSLTYGHHRTGTASYVARGGVWCNFIPCWVWRQWTCICIAFALFENYWNWSFMLPWIGDKEYSFYLYEEYCSIHLWWWFIIMYNVLYFLIEITLDKYSYYEPLFIYDMYSSMFKSMSNEPVIWMTCSGSLLAEIYSHPSYLSRCLIWMLAWRDGSSGTSSLFHLHLEIIMILLSCCSKLRTN